MRQRSQMERMWVGLIVDFSVIRYHNDSCNSNDNYNDDSDSHNDYDHHYFDLQQLLLCE
jgi:hypothetical protein